MWKEEKISYHEKIRFLENEHKSLLEKNNVPFKEIKQQRKEAPSKNEIFHHRTNVLNMIMNKCKSSRDKRSLGYVNKIKTPISGETIFVKDKEETPNLVTSSSTLS